MTRIVEYPYTHRDTVNWGGFFIDFEDGTLFAYDNKQAEHFGGGEVSIRLDPLDAVRLGRELINWGSGQAEDEA